MFLLCSEFGIVPSTVQVYFDYGLKILMRTVRDLFSSFLNLRWPIYPKNKESANLFETNRKNREILMGIFAVNDGARMPCAKIVNTNIRNPYFEIFTQDTKVTNLLVWNFKAKSFMLV